MTNSVLIAIDGNALFEKSKVYVGRALKAKTDNDLDQYQLWASLALELLGKGLLAQKHPSLVVDPTHWQSLFAAAGITITTDVKTITAKTLFERLAHLVPRFDKSIQRFCLEISERRNAELHSAEVPFRPMRLEAWEARFWHACDTILTQMGSSIEQWVGASGAQAPRHLLQEARSALTSAIKLRIEAAKGQFEGLNKTERERRSQAANEKLPWRSVELFKGAYDQIWTLDCPACGCRACMTGDQSAEDFSENRDEYAIWEIVEREFTGEEFVCPACELSLTGNDEISAAGLDYLHNDRFEREMEYEPDYGND